MTPQPIAGLRGRLPVKPPGQRLAIDFLDRYLLAPLSAPKYPIDVSGGITQWQMLGNGPDPTLTVNGGRPVGDCTFAGRQHLRMAKAAAAGITEVWETTDELVSEYLAYDHGVDRGANIAEVLTYWFLTGKIRAFAPVDHRDPVGCDGVMAAFHGLYVGVDLTDSADDQFNAAETWTMESGERPDPSDGHCIVKVRADGDQYDTWVTWGALQRSTRQWTAACIREAWAIITTEDETSKLDMPALLADITAATATTTATPPSVTRDQNAGASAFALGWHVAELYQPFPEPERPGSKNYLPSIAEYDFSARITLGFDQVDALLERAGLGDLGRNAIAGAQRASDPARRTRELKRLHVRVLDRLACEDESQAAAYQLGTALSAFCRSAQNEAPEASRGVDDILGQFTRDRQATLHAWLGQMSALAPAAIAVSRSLRNWSGWVDANTPSLKREWNNHERTVRAAARSQSVVWERLLSNPASAAIQPPIGAWVHAGEQIVRSTEKTVAQVCRWFWPVILILLAATGGLLYLALNDAEGTARVWAALVTVAGGLAASGAGIRTGARRVAAGVEQSAWRAAELEAQAWTITWLPTIHQSLLTRYRLRRSGVSPPAGGTQLEQVGTGGRAS
jgi:hypothetical protein